MFIVFEGSDGCGKTTLISKFRNMLEKHTGKEVVLLREPGGTVYGEVTRNVFINKDIPMDNTTSLLQLMAIRNQLIVEKIKPALAEGKIVLCDRFHLSTIAYQFRGEDKDESFYFELHEKLWGLLFPDLNVIFRVDRETVKQRKLLDAKDRLESKDSSFYDKVDGYYNEVCTSPTFNLYKRICVVDNNSSIEETEKYLDALAYSLSVKLERGEI